MSNLDRSQFQLSNDTKIVKFGQNLVQKFLISQILWVLGALAENTKKHLATPPQLNQDLWAEATLAQDKQDFYDNHWFIYKDDFFSEETHGLILQEMRHLWGSEELHTNCNLDGRDRLGGYVLDPLLLLNPQENPQKPSRENDHHHPKNLYELIYESEELREWVSKINGHQMFPSDFPIELRQYGAESQGMPCHRDLLMYKNATLDLEFVYTIDNFSKDCISSFVDR